MNTPAGIYDETRSTVSSLIVKSEPSVITAGQLLLWSAITEAGTEIIVVTKWSVNTNVCNCTVHALYGSANNEK